MPSSALFGVPLTWIDWPTRKPSWIQLPAAAVPTPARVMVSPPEPLWANVSFVAVGLASLAKY